MLVLRLAWRNVWRHSRRSVVTMAAIALSLWAMVLYAGIGQGWMHGMERDLLDLELGDVQIHAEGYRENPSLWTTLDDPDALLAALDAEGLRATPRLVGGGLAAHGEASAGVMLRGTDVAREGSVSNLPGAVGQGQWLDPADPTGVVVGRRLARTLGVGLGDEIVVLSQAADGSTANGLYAVRGILLGVSGGVDQAGLFMVADAFRELMALPEGTHQIVVRRPPDRSLDALKATVAAAAPGTDVATWRELVPALATMLDSAAQIFVMVYAVVYLAIGILMLNAMLMAVFERIREIGVMKALGMRPRVVVALMLTEVAIQVGIAGAVAAVLAVPVGWWTATAGIPLGSLAGGSFMGLAISPRLVAIYSVETVTPPVVILLVMVGLAVLYPALHAARLDPVAAMRHR